MNLSRHSLLTAATMVVAWAACPPAEAALREASGTGVKVEAEYILPSAGRSANELGTVGNFGTLNWVGRRSSNASGSVVSTSEAPAVLCTAVPEGAVVQSGDPGDGSESAFEEIPAAIEDADSAASDMSGDKSGPEAT